MDSCYAERDQERLVQVFNCNAADITQAADMKEAMHTMEKYCISELKTWWDANAPGPTNGPKRIAH